MANSPTAGAPGSTLHHAAAGEPAEVPASLSGLGPLSGFPNRSPNPSAAPRARCANPAPAPAAKVGVLRGPSKPLPGSRATTVQPADLWHAWFGALSSADCGLSVFFHSLRELPREGRGPSLRASHHQRLWPMPLPYPELLVPGAATEEPRGSG